jgi:TolB-like protein
MLNNPSCFEMMIRIRCKFMKETIKKILPIFLVMFLTIAAHGEDIKKIAIIPFDVSSKDNIEYVREGITDVLASRVTIEGKTTVVSKKAVLDIMEKYKKRNLEEKNVYVIGTQLKADYVIWGSISKISESVTFEGKLMDVSAQKSILSVNEKIQDGNEFMPKVSEFAKRITSYLTGEKSKAETVRGTKVPTGSAMKETTAAGVQLQAGGRPAGKFEGEIAETDIVAGMKKGKTTYTAAVNPAVIKETRSQLTRGFWISQKFGTAFKGMDIGDVNGDGRNEVVIIDSMSVMIFQKSDNELVLIEKMNGKEGDNFIAVDVADINGDGTSEIFVTNMNRNILESFVLEYREGKFQRIASDVPWLLRVINIGSKPTLIGQAVTRDQTGKYPPIREMLWKNGQYAAGQDMKIPRGISIYGLAVESLEENKPERIICLDESDYIRIYDQAAMTGKQADSAGDVPTPIWKSSYTYGGSPNVFSSSETTKLTGQQSRGNNLNTVRLRILGAGLSKGGKRQFLVVKNTLERTSRKVKRFTESEIYNLEWNGRALIDDWNTKKIKGYVADYQIKDIDNDGKNEIALAVVQSIGESVQTESAIIYYKTNAPKRSNRD